MKNTRECAASGRPERAGENRSAASRRPTRAGEKTLKRGSTTSRKPGADIIRANAKKAGRDDPRRGARHEARAPQSYPLGAAHERRRRQAFSFFTQHIKQTFANE